MDLILAHKRAVKLCELCGLSLIVQTSVATAVSEIARCAIEYGKNSSLILAIDQFQGKSLLKAIVSDSNDFSEKVTEPVNYAKRLVDDVSIEKKPRDFRIILKQSLNINGIITEAKIQTFIAYFKIEPALSPYDELRRKNIMLQELAEKLKESEGDYRILTDSLPLMMFSVNSRGQILYANKWLQDFFGTIPKELSTSAWQGCVDIEDHPSFAKDLNNAFQWQSQMNGQFRFIEKVTQKSLWHNITVIPLKNEKEILQRWIGLLVDIDAQKSIERALKDNKELQKTQEALFANQEELQQKIIELNRSNYELEQFAHLATHDLQEPLRKLFFISDTLKRKYAAIIDSAGVTMLDSMIRAATRMRELITDLLSYSQLQQQKMSFDAVDLNAILAEIVKDLEVQVKEKNATFIIDDLPVIFGNGLRLRQLFSNLISNSLKYSKSNVPPRISITTQQAKRDIVISFKDNGIGFDEAYCEKIFGLFERLHTKSQYPGTGIGLAICKRIVELHKGNITALSMLNEFAMFEITLPLGKNENGDKQ